MKFNIYKNILLILFLLISRGVFSQDGDVTIDPFKDFYFKCYGDKDSIMLPEQFRGPKYYYYEEGSIISFIAIEDSVRIGATVKILCGGDAVLTFQDSYAVIDTVTENGKVVSLRYYNKDKKIYARMDYLIHSTIIYENVKEDKMQEYNMLFDMYAGDRRRK